MNKDICPPPSSFIKGDLCFLSVLTCHRGFSLLSVKPTDKKVTIKKLIGGINIIC